MPSRLCLIKSKIDFNRPIHTVLSHDQCEIIEWWKNRIIEPTVFVCRLCNIDDNDGCSADGYRNITYPRISRSDDFSGFKLEIQRPFKRHHVRNVTAIENNKKHPFTIRTVWKLSQCLSYGGERREESRIITPNRVIFVKKKLNESTRRGGGDGVDGYDGLRFGYSESTVIDADYDDRGKKPNFDTHLYNWSFGDCAVSHVNTVNMSIQSEIPIAWGPFNSGGGIRVTSFQSPLFSTQNPLCNLRPVKISIDRLLLCGSKVYSSTVYAK